MDACLVIVVSAPIERLCSNEGIGIAFHFKPTALNPASEEPPSTLCSMTPILAKVLFQKKKKAGARGRTSHRVEAQEGPSVPFLTSSWVGL